MLLARSLRKGRAGMLEQAFSALAEAGGTAVVQAAGTDAWAGLRRAVAGWFGRGDEQRERAELERLDQAAGELETAEAAGVERVRVRHQVAWRARIEALLESMDDAGRAQAANELRALLSQHAPGGGVSAGQGALAVGGNVDIRAKRGSIAAGVIHGGAHIGPPQAAGPAQG